MATNSNIMVPSNYTTKYSNLVHGWNTSHPTTISKKFIHYLHAVNGATGYGHGMKLAITFKSTARYKDCQ